MSKQHITVILFFVTLLLVVIFAWQHHTPGSLSARLEKSLLYLGFQTDSMSVAEVASQADTIQFSNIRFDADGFNTIQSITVPKKSFSLFSGKHFDVLALNHMIMTLSSQDLYSTLAGIDWLSMYRPFPQIGYAAVDDAQFDVSTPLGGLRFESTGFYNTTSPEEAVSEGRLWADQNQMSFEGQWKGRFHDHETTIVETEIRNGRVLFDHIKADRVNGWLIWEKDSKAFPVIKGQFSAGYIRLNDIPLIGTVLTVNGPINDFNALIKGQIKDQHQQPLIFTLDVGNKLGSITVDADVVAYKIDTILAFMQHLKALFDSDSYRSSSLTPLLLTPGNLERVKDILGKAPYDQITLKISGPLNDLDGKIIAKTKDGSLNVISLDPAD